MKLMFTLLLLSWLACAADGSDDFGARCADRAAIERVYHSHRLGEKSSLEQSLPPAMLESLVRLDLRKEAVLQRTYGIEITSAMLDAEVQRINTTTRAPEMLAEIKAALGNDPARFARAMARPILVERLLRARFENDDALHAAQRREAGQVRTRLTNMVAAFRTSRGTEAPSSSLVEQLLAGLKASHPDAVRESTWQLRARPAETNAPAADEVAIKQRFGPNAQILSAPPAGGQEAKTYFADLPGELQNVLRVQLRQPGDVSAVIETPGGFLLYVARETSETELSAAGLALPKRSYEQWLNEQSEGKP